MIATHEVSEFFVEVADTLVRDFDVVDFLHTVTERSARVSGAPAVGLMLADHEQRLQYMAASNEQGRLLELIQLGLDEGPCPDCFRTRTPVINSDLRDPAVPWPRFAHTAVEAGYTQVHAFPLRLREEAIGAMSIFGTKDTVFSAEEISVVQALADVATIGVLQERALARAETLTEQLQGALNSRVLIEQAKGAVAVIDGIPVETAFARLRTYARNRGERLADVAARVVSTPPDDPWWNE